MANLFSKLWLNSPGFFDPIQYFFNGSFWEEFLKRFGGAAKGSVVDLACGTGELRRHISPKNYLGIDFNPDFIAHAQKLIHFAKTKFEVGDITKNKIKDNPDAIFFISAAHHLDDNQMTQLSRNLKASKIRKLILVDGRPKGILARPLAFLDAWLGGGKYFRSSRELVDLVGPHLKIQESGEFSARLSFYTYPFLIATAIRP